MTSELRLTYYELFLITFISSQIIQISFKQVIIVRINENQIIFCPQVDEEPSLPVSSAGSYDNKAFVHHETHQREMRTTSSLYSETVAAEMETSSMTAANASRTAIARHMVATPIEPKFDVQMRVKRVPLPPPSPLPSESDIASVALERNLTTILEKEESSLTRSLESPPARMTTFSYVPELHGPLGGTSSTSTISRQQTPPVYSRILRKQAERETTTSTSMIQERIPSPSPIEQPPLQHHEIRRPRSLTSLNTELTETRSLTEVTDHTHAKYRVANILAPTPPPPHQLSPRLPLLIQLFNIANIVCSEKR